MERRRGEQDFDSTTMATLPKIPRCFPRRASPRRPPSPRTGSSRGTPFVCASARRPLLGVSDGKGDGRERCELGSSPSSLFERSVDERGCFELAEGDKLLVPRLPLPLDNHRGTSGCTRDATTKERCAKPEPKERELGPKRDNGNRWQPCGFSVGKREMRKRSFFFFAQPRPIFSFQRRPRERITALLASRFLINELLPLGFFFLFLFFCKGQRRGTK